MRSCLARLSYTELLAVGGLKTATYPNNGSGRKRDFVSTGQSAQSIGNLGIGLSKVHGSSACIQRNDQGEC